MIETNISSTSLSISSIHPSPSMQTRESEYESSAIATFVTVDTAREEGAVVVNPMLDISTTHPSSCPFLQDLPIRNASNFTKYEGRTYKVLISHMRDSVFIRMLVPFYMYF